MDEFSFRAFAAQPFFREVNARLVEEVDPKPGQRLVDLACGTGLITRLILEKLRDVRDTLIFAVDQSAGALRQAQAELGGARDQVVLYIQGRAEQLSQILRERVDAVLFGNAIHMVPDKGGLMAEVSNTLRQGGLFAFNTSFYAHHLAPETEQFYRRWMGRALRILRREHELSPAPEKVEARRQLTVEEYRSLLEGHGFVVKEERVQVVPVPLEGWLSISSFRDFIAGALPGVELPKASQVLKEAAQQAFRELQIQTVPRNWLYVVAQRT